jgi:ABC-type phosphate transport system substrate-binding protein
MLPLRATLAGLTALLLCAALPAAADDFKVVVHPDNPVAELSAGDVSRLFLKKTLRWSDGRPVQPVEPATPRVRERFAATVHEKSVNAVKSYWNQLIFSGRDVPPLEKADDAGVLAYVKANAGAVGYVSPGADLSGVKVLLVKP